MVFLQASEAMSVNKLWKPRNTGFFQISIPSRSRRRNIATEGSLSIVPYLYKNFIGKSTDVEQKVKSKKGDSRTVLSGLLFLVFCCQDSHQYLETF